MDEPTIRRRKLTEYRPDPKNANRGTERGTFMLEQSVQEVGATRSLVASADDAIPIGNHAMQALADAGITDVIEVETDGNQVVVVKRRDWESIDDPTARRAAIWDNRTSEVSLNWDVSQLLMDAEEGVDFSAMFFENELQALVQQAVADEGASYDLLERIPDLGKPPVETEADAEPAKLRNEARFPLAIVLSIQDLRRWRTLKEDVLGYKDDSRAFLALLERCEEGA